MSKENFSDIAAYRNNWWLQITDWVTILPLLRYLQSKTTSSLHLEYLGDRSAIERDLKHGATFLTNHRDIVMDAAWLSMLVRCRYNIRPYMGMGDNLFGKWWIEGLARYNHVYVVKRGVGAHELIEKSKHLSRYITSLREQEHSIWLAEREGRAKDSNDRAQGSVLKMLCMAYLDENKTTSDENKTTGQQANSFFTAVKKLNICPVSISYEYDPCDYLKAMEFQLKRDNPRWRKRKKDDILSMKTGILGHKGKVVFRLTPSINAEVDELMKSRPEILTAPVNDQAQAICDIIDRHVWAGYENYHHFDANMQPTPDFDAYIRSRVALIDMPNKDEQYLYDRIVEMYKNPVLNQASVATGHYVSSGV